MSSNKSGRKSLQIKAILYSFLLFVIITATVMSSGCAGVTSAGQTTGTGDPPPTLAVTVSSLPSGTTQTAYSAVLSASGGTTPYSWSIASGQLPTGLALNATSGAISGTPTAAGAFTFTVKVTDSGSPAQTASAGLSITITSSKTPMQISVTSLPAGETGASYRAILSATGGTAPYTWSMASGSLPAGLALSTAGDITGTPTQAGTTSFAVKATDSSSPAETATQSLSITIAAAGGPLQITTLSLPSGQVGTAYSTSLTAIGGTSPYSWSVTSGSLPAGLSLTATSGTISGTPTAAATSTFTIQVKDSSVTPGTATKSFSVTIAAAQPPTISTSSLPGGTVGTAYSTTLAATGGKTPYTWSVSSGSLPAGLSLAASTGVISGTPTTSGTVSFTVEVKDANSSTATKSLSIVVAAAQPPTISTSSLPGGTVGTAYSTTLAATGGKTPYTWSVSSGSLPAGLSLAASTGVISGTPTTSGTASFTVQVKDANNSTATKSLSIVVAATTQPPSITTSSLPAGTVNSSYSTTLAATGGKTPYSWSISTGSLPAGLSLAASTGVISGTPTASGTSSFTVKVTDSSSPAQTATANLSISVTAPALQITTTSLPGGQVGTSYSAVLVASGGTSPYTWTVSSGSLPAGLSLSSAGQITGTPTTASSSTFTIKVTDSASNTATKSLSISVSVINTSDPLNSGFYPSVDNNCGDSQYDPNVWMSNVMQKIMQGSGTPNPGNACTIAVYATQGEFADFQVHVLAPSGGYAALTVTASSFVQSSPSSFTIPAPSASSNDVVVYREAYIPVTTKTSTSSLYYNQTGNYPDPLIPAIDPYFHQVTNAFPVAVNGGNNQSAWIDVYIPPTAPSGFYLGSVTVSNDGTTLATMPVVIGVWQWPASQGGRLPATPTLPTETQFGYSDFCNAIYGGSGGTNCGAYPGAGGSANNALVLSDMAGAVLMMDHRWTMTDPVQGSASQYAGLWNGTSVLPSGVPSPILTGATVTSQNYRGQTSVYGSEQGFANLFGSASWPYGSTGTYPKVSPEYYTADEPGSSASSWTGLCNLATTAHSTNPPIATLITGYISAMNYNSGTSGCTAQGVENSVDIMVVPNMCLEPNAMYTCSAGEGGATPPVGNDRSTYDAWLSHTNPDGIQPSIWSYISCSSSGTCGGAVGNLNYPNYNVDSKPSGNRAAEWVTFLNQQTGELYYYTTCEWETGCAAEKDPWTGVYQFGNNGDGDLLYPSSWNLNGTPAQHVTQQNGSPLTTPLWVGDIRLKLMRDGGQDWEYMQALTKAGESVFVTTQIASWVTNSYTFETTGSGLMAARCNLGAALHQLTYSSTTGPNCQASSGTP